MAQVDEKHRDHPKWKSFCRRLVMVYRKAKRLHETRDELPQDDFETEIGRLEERLSKLANESWKHSDAARLAKRLAKYCDELLTFLWCDDVPMNNNVGERAIRPAVMIRRNCEYRFYTCAKRVKTGYANCELPSISAGELETMVINQLRSIFRQPEIIARTFREVAAHAEVGPVRTTWQGWKNYAHGANRRNRAFELCWRSKIPTASSFSRS